MKLLKRLLFVLALGVVAGCTHGPFPLDESSPEPKWITALGSEIKKPYTVQFYRLEGCSVRDKIKAVIQYDGGRKEKTVWGTSIKYTGRKQPGDVALWVIEMNGIRETYQCPDQSTRLFLYDPSITNLTDNAVRRIAFERKEADLERLSSKAKRFYELDDVATAAFSAGDFEKAAAYSRELLEMTMLYKQDWNYGNAVHKGNIMLGRLALRQGDVEDAKKRLIEGGKTTGSPQLNSFGPNMSLAKDLLEKGERDIVLQYFVLCRQFWKMDYGKLSQWTEQVKQGGTPDFGANLVY
jgi:hypothetical protein